MIKIPVLMLVVSCVVARSAEPVSAPKETPVATIPAGGRTQELSTRMQAELDRLHLQNAFCELDSWTRLRKLPSWVSDKKYSPESVYLPATGLGVDMFQHTVIIGKNRPTIVIRRGGFAGVYQIFQEPKQPNQPAEPMATPVTAPAGQEPHLP